MRSQPVLLLLAFLSLCLAGCQSNSAPELSKKPAATTTNPSLIGQPPITREQDEANPIDMAPHGSKSVSFERAILTMNSGSPIGKVTTGWLNIERETLRATPGEGSKQFASVAKEELRNAHYTTPSEQNELFGNDDGSKIRLKIGAEITSLHLDVHYEPGFAGVTAESRGTMTVNWQIYDSVTKKVVYSRTLEINYTNSSKNGEGEPAVFKMFRTNFRKLLSLQEFATFMAPDLAQN